MADQQTELEQQMRIALTLAVNILKELNWMREPLLLLGSIGHTADYFSHTQPTPMITFLPWNHDDEGSSIRFHFQFDENGLGGVIHLVQFKDSYPKVIRFTVEPKGDTSPQVDYAREFHVLQLGDMLSGPFPLNHLTLTKVSS